MSTDTTKWDLFHIRMTLELMASTESEWRAHGVEDVFLVTSDFLQGAADSLAAIEKKVEYLETMLTIRDRQVAELCPRVTEEDFERLRKIRQEIEAVKP